MAFEFWKSKFLMIWKTRKNLARKGPRGSDMSGPYSAQRLHRDSVSRVTSMSWLHVTESSGKSRDFLEVLLERGTRPCSGARVTSESHPGMLARVTRSCPCPSVAWARATSALRSFSGVSWSDTTESFSQKLLNDSDMSGQFHRERTRTRVSCPARHKPG